MQDARTARRRWCGLLFLLLAGGMTAWGLTWLEPSLRGRAFVLYWVACAGFLFLAMLVAVVDFVVMLTAARRERREVTNRTVASAAETPPDQQTTSPSPPSRS